MMTTKLLLRTAALFCAMLLGMTLQAQPIHYFPSSQSTEKSNVTFFSYASLDTSLFEIQQIEKSKNCIPKTQATPMRGTTDGVNITINVDFADKPYLADMFGATIILVSDENEVYSKNDITEQTEFTITPGNYDIIFYTSDGFTCYYVIHENVEVNHNSTHDVSLVEATNQISIENYAPDGQQFMVGLGHQDEETGEWIHTVDGNVVDVYVNSILIKKDYGQLTSILNGFSAEVDDNSGVPYRTLPFFCFYVNDVSSKYLFLQDRTCRNSADEWFCNSFSCNDVSADTIIRNNPIDYYCNDYSYVYSKDGLGKVGQGIAVPITHIYNDYITSVWYAGLYKNENKLDSVACYKVYLSIPYEDINDTNLKTVVGTNFADCAELMDFGDFSFYTYSDDNIVFCTPCAIINGERYYINLGNPKEYINFAESIGFFDVQENGRLLNKTHSHPAFTYPTSLKLGEFGASCPINSTLIKNHVSSPWGNEPISDVRINYIGRYGELRGCDNPHAIETVYYNGEFIENNNTPTNQLGIYERTYLNTNIEVDGLQGKNLSTVHYDMTQNDMTPPSMIMLHFKNNEGYIIDRFSSSEYGTMEFSAGDFNSILETYNDQYYFVFDCQPVEVLVEYAPYGTEDWNELAVEEIPEYYQEPGWGDGSGRKGLV